MTTEDLLGWLTECGYSNLRVLPDDTIVGTHDLIYTRGLCIGLDAWGYEDRYCYPDRQRATEACNALTSGDDKPIEGYVAERHRPE